jgi:hypothetical protein
VTHDVVIQRGSGMTCHLTTTQPKNGLTGKIM